jgi:hypothetical protein
VPRPRRGTYLYAGPGLPACENYPSTLPQKQVSPDPSPTHLLLGKDIMRHAIPAMFHVILSNAELTIEAREVREHAHEDAVIPD